MWRQPISRRRLLRLSILAGGTALLGSPGCDRGDGNKPATDAGKPALPDALRVLVIDDPDLGQAIQREWRSRTESEVVIDRGSMQTLADASRLPGDVVIFPASMLGHLVERGLIRTLGESMLDSEPIAMQDIFPLTRRHEITWGEKTYALPLGSPQFVLAYRPDLLTRLNLPVPAAWDDYQATVAKLSDRAALGDAVPAGDQPWRATAEPTGAGFGGSLLLARAAAYASHRDQATQLFDLAKLDPLIDKPPYVRALTELAASIKASDTPGVASPGDAYAELLAGRCGMALCWPTGDSSAAEAAKAPAIAFSELPGSTAVYNFGQGRWEERRADEDGRVTFLGTAGRLAAVSSSTSQSAAAEGLVGWLAGAEVSSRTASRSRAATLFRVSHRSALGRWLGDLPAASAEQYFDVVQQAQSRARSMSTIRLPGSHRYLAELDGAVHRTTVEGQNPEASLGHAAEAWRNITAELGAAAQRTALSHSLERS